MWSKIIKIFKYILAVTGVLRVINFFRNIFLPPLFYDAFLTGDNGEVCLIAPYYVRPAIEKIRGGFLVNERVVEVRPRLIDDPEKGCLVVLFPVPAEVGLGDSIRLQLKKGGKIFFDKVLKKTPVSAKYHLAITTLFKYEIDYLKEWLEHHLKMGVEHFYLYDNNKRDDTRALSVLKEYMDKGLVTYIRWPYSYVLYNFKIKYCWPNDSFSFTQSAQINDAVYRSKGETKWLLYCDLDEYFFSLNGKSMEENVETIAAGKEVSSLVVSGKWFGGSAADLKKLPARGVTKTFIQAEDGLNSPPKCFFQTKNIIMASIHKVSLKNRGEDIIVPPEMIRFNHYRALGWKKRLDPTFAVESKNTNILDL